MGELNLVKTQLASAEKELGKNLQHMANQEFVIADLNNKLAMCRCDTRPTAPRPKPRKKILQFSDSEDESTASEDSVELNPKVNTRQNTDLFPEMKLLPWMEQVTPPTTRENKLVKHKKMTMTATFGGGTDVAAYLNFRNQFGVSNFGQRGEFILQDLKSKTWGEALDRIKNLEGGLEAAQEAMVRLNNDYGTKDMVILHYTRQIQGLTTATDGKSLKALRNKLDEAVFNLERIGHPLGGLVAIASQKLSDAFWYEMNDKGDKQLSSMTMAELLERINKELKRHSAMPRIGGDVTHTHAVSSLAAARTAQTGGPNTCHFCEERHATYLCSKPLKPIIRMSIVKRNGLCFKCLQQGHTARNCPVYKTKKDICIECDRAHNTLLHDPTTHHKPSSSAKKDQSN